MVIDFKMKNTHLTTQTCLFDFHIPFHSPCLLCTYLLCSPFQINSQPAFTQQQPLFPLLHWRICKIDLLKRKAAPERRGCMCVVAAAAASWLALLAAPRLYPAVCQTAKQGKRWDKWLFMICHIPSSLLSPGPIYYSCRLPPCRRERAHTNTKYYTVCTLAQWPNTHTRAFTQSDFFQYLVPSKTTYLRDSLLSCHLPCCGNSPNFISSAGWKIRCYTFLVVHLH